MSFGETLQQLREKNNMTQTDLAKKLNLSKSNISKYESGDLEPNLKTLNLLSNIFQVNINYLIGEFDNPASPNKTKEATPPLGSEEWLRNGLAARGITKLTDKQLEFLLKNIDFIANQLKNSEE